MIISKNYKFIFVRNPKTGTVAVAEYIKRHELSVEDKTYLLGAKKLTFTGHETPLSIKTKMQKDYLKFKKFVFVRHPYDKVVSAYFFLKNGNPLTKGSIWNYTNSLNSFLKALITYFNIVSARIIPFRIWSLFRSVKKNSIYLLDKESKFIVNYVGRTENLNEDLKRIFHELNVVLNHEDKVERSNTSKHKSYMEYYSNKLHKRLFDWLNKEEIELYELILKKGCTFDFEDMALRDLVKEEKHK